MPIQIVRPPTEGRKVPVKIWAGEERIEAKAMGQLEETAKMPFIFKHIAVMPDVHWGMGSTVGSVIPTKKAIIPAAVGVDIGCGMMAVQTTLNRDEVRDKTEEIRSQIERCIPLGPGIGNAKIRDSVDAWQGWKTISEHIFIEHSIDKARHQMGSLGGGNHFIEVCEDTQGKIWVMLHSGSRGVGNKVARLHIGEAKGLMKQFLIDLPNADLAYLPEGTREFREYMADLRWLQDYALQNRIEMMDRVLDQLRRIFDFDEKLERVMEVNCHHNYTARENHYGENVWLTRKGAVSAREGELGIIPGSMGAKSFIVRGTGNKESFTSCSHGAGRRMSRGQARREFSTEDLVKQTEGVECRKDKDVVDEIPGAYKDIEAVMKDQEDLVTVVAEMKQFLCVKGG